MQLLEKVAQDIKTVRNYTPCAPDFFRWVVVGGYLTVVLSALVWGLFVVRERQQEASQNKDKIKLQEIVAQLAEVQQQTAQTGKLRARYEEWNNWLKGNYTLSKFLAQTFTVLPQGARLQELDLRENAQRPGAFSIKMRFFAQGENRVTNTQEFEDKLAALGVNLQDSQQSVSEGGKMEMNASLVLPRSFYPAGVGPAMPAGLPMTAGPNSAPPAQGGLQ